MNAARIGIVAAKVKVYDASFRKGDAMVSRDVMRVFLMSGSASPDSVRSAMEAMEFLFLAAESGIWPLVVHDGAGIERLRRAYDDVFRRVPNRMFPVDRLALMSLRGVLSEGEIDRRLAQIDESADISAAVYLASLDDFDFGSFDAAERTLTDSLCADLREAGIGRRPLGATLPNVWESVTDILFFFIGFVQAGRNDAGRRFEQVVRTLAGALPVGFQKDRSGTLVLLAR